MIPAMHNPSPLGLDRRLWLSPVSRATTRTAPRQVVRILFWGQWTQYLLNNQKICLIPPPEFPVVRLINALSLFERGHGEVRNVGDRFRNFCLNCFRCLTSSHRSPSKTSATAGRFMAACHFPTRLLPGYSPENASPTFVSVPTIIKIKCESFIMESRLPRFSGKSFTEISRVFIIIV